MKLLLVNNGKGWGGGQEHLKDLALELRENGVEVQFLVRADTVSVTRYGELGFTVHLMPYKHGLNIVKSFSNLVATLRRERYDIISINREHDLQLTVLANRAAFPFGGGPKVMMSYHTTTDRKQALIGAVDAVVCISEHVRDKLFDGNPGIAKKTTIPYYGIFLPPAPGAERFQDERPRRFLKGLGFPLIGMVGEFWKNQEELIGLVPLLKEKFPGIKVALVGPMPGESHHARLKEQIAELGVEENIIFTGQIPRSEIPALFHDLNLSVTTHRNEGFGIVHLESLAAGTPVVAYNEGGFVDLFKGEPVGVLIDGGAQEFAQAVIDLLENREKRYEMGRLGRDLVEHKYSIKAMGATYLGFYRTLLGG